MTANRDQLDLWLFMVSGQTTFLEWMTAEDADRKAATLAVQNVDKRVFMFRGECAYEAPVPEVRAIAMDELRPGSAA